MEKAGYQTIDNMSVYEFLADKKAKKKFEEYGGYQTIKEITETISEDNVEAYYDELVKNNFLIRLHILGFDVISNLDKFSEMTAEQVYDYYDYQLADAAIGKVEKITAVDLSDGYEEAIEEWDKGGEVGFPIGIKMLNHRTLGIHRKNFTIHLAGIGIGKTVSAVSWYILPAIEEGHKVCIIANEQDCSQWRQMILSTVMFNKLKNEGGIKGFDRHNMLKGHYKAEHKQKMYDAADWIKKQEGKITFVETQDYSAQDIQKIIKKYTRLGINYFIVDTLKPADEASDKAWASFSETAKTLFLLAKKLDIAIIGTAQLKAESMGNKFLTMEDIGKSRAIGETASTVIMFRPVTSEEKEHIQPYGYSKDNKKVKELKTLDEDKDYIVIFTPKNRYGPVSPQIVVERNLAFNSYKEIGWYEQPYQRRR